MELHEQQQFEFFLQTAVERYVERVEQRFRGSAGALELLESNPDDPQAWLDGFVDAVFEDFLLSGAGGACFVLRALSRSSVNSPIELTGNIESILVHLAKHQFRNLLLAKSIEALGQHSRYQGV